MPAAAPGTDRARMGGLRVVLGPADRARRAGRRPAGGRRRARRPRPTRIEEAADRSAADRGLPIEATTEHPCADATGPSAASGPARVRTRRRSRPRAGRCMVTAMRVTGRRGRRRRGRHHHRGGRAARRTTPAGSPRRWPDILVCRGTLDSLRRAAAILDDRRPGGVSGAGGHPRRGPAAPRPIRARLELLEADLGALVVLPYVRRWATLADPVAEAAQPARRTGRSATPAPACVRRGAAGAGRGGDGLGPPRRGAGPNRSAVARVRANGPPIARVPATGASALSAPSSSTRSAPVRRRNVRRRPVTSGSARRESGASRAARPGAGGDGCAAAAERGADRPAGPPAH